MRDARSARRPRVEPLEAKQMLAGDVAVSVEDGRLSILGDELDNQVAIRSAEEPGAFVVVGLDGTSVTLLGDESAAEAQPDGGAVVTGVRSADIRMGAGDDTVIVNDAAFVGAVNIATGAGADSVVVGAPIGGDTATGESATDGPGVVVRRSLRIATGAGADRVRVADAAVGRNLTVATGEGADGVSLGAPTPVAAPTAADTLTDEAPEREPLLRVGGEVRVALGAGDDNAMSTGVAARAIHAFGGEGDDTIVARDTRSAGLWLRGGEGEDTLRVVDASAGAAWFDAGAGDDRVEVVDSAFGLLGAWLGEGDDELVVAGNSARVALLFGGPGELDALVGLGTNDFGRQVVRGFETSPTPGDEPATV